MKIYLAGPLFSVAEKVFNRELKDLLEDAGHDVWLPQEQTLERRDALSILSKLLAGLRASEVVVANMDGADPDSGTSWECGYAVGIGKPVIIFRTDFRREFNTDLGPFNLMIWASATARLDGPFQTVDQVAEALVKTIAEINSKSPKSTHESKG